MLASQYQLRKSSFLQLPSTLISVVVDNVEKVAWARNLLGLDNHVNTSIDTTGHIDDINKASTIDRQVSVVGIDCEWRAVMPGVKAIESGVSILQVTTPTHALIFDLRKSDMDRVNTVKNDDNNNSSSSSSSGSSSSKVDNQQRVEWDSSLRNLLRNLFKNTNIVKVGWDFSKSDMTMLRKGCYVETCEPLLDIADIIKSYFKSGECKKIFKNDMMRNEKSSENTLRVPTTMEGSSRKTISDIITSQLNATPITTKSKADKTREGLSVHELLTKDQLSLSDAAKLLLGKPIDKAQRMSNWDCRPLTSEQIAYASLDGYVLLQMLWVLASGVGQDFTGNATMSWHFLRPNCKKIGY